MVHIRLLTAARQGRSEDMKRGLELRGQTPGSADAKSDLLTNLQRDVSDFVYQKKNQIITT